MLGQLDIKHAGPRGRNLYKNWLSPRHAHSGRAGTGVTVLGQRLNKYVVSKRANKWILKISRLSRQFKPSPWYHFPSEPQEWIPSGKYYTANLNRPLTPDSTHHLCHWVFQFRVTRSSRILMYVHISQSSCYRARGKIAKKKKRVLN